MLTLGLRIPLTQKRISLITFLKFVERLIILQVRKALLNRSKLFQQARGN